MKLLRPQKQTGELRRKSAETPAEVPLLMCKGLQVAYGRVRVLFGIDMQIDRGEIVALLGTNGAGKSTLLKAVSGLVSAVEGSIAFGGLDITHADPRERASLGIVQMPGGRAIFPTLTVAEHFKASTWLFARESTAEAHDRTERVLDQFPQLAQRWHQAAGDLSGGEQQQLGLGMAFVAKPRLLLIDELSLGLAPILVEQLLDIVRAIHAEGCTVVLVEQSVNVALKIADRAYFMEKGEVRFEGPTSELLGRGDVLRSVFLGDARPTSSAAHAGKRLDESDLRAFDRQDVTLGVSGLTKRFGGIGAVDEVAFQLHDGEILGLIGPNGSGKTTIVDLISGVVPPDRGRVQLRGVEITRWSAARRSAAGLGRSFQDARIFPSLTVSDNIAIGVERHVGTRDHLAAFLDLPTIQDSERDVSNRVEELIELLRLGSYRDHFASELSTGVRRIVDLAMIVAHKPTVLLLDEPSSGVAQRETEALAPLLKDVQQVTKCSIVIIEHDMPLIREVCDTVVALELGRVLVYGAPSKVLADARVVASYLGGGDTVVHRPGVAPH